MRIVQFTDTHVCEPGKRHYRIFDSAHALARCVAAVNALVPRADVVVVTGDIAGAGAADEYAHARAILAALDVPYFVLPGNHDRLAALVAAFGAHLRSTPGIGVSYAIDDFPVRLLLLDSTVAGRHGGDVDVAKLAWLAERLDEAPERPTLVAVHHPPFEPKVPLLDIFPFRGAAALGALLAPRKNVLRVVAGHVHHRFDARWYDTSMSTAMSTSPQLFPHGIGPLPVVFSVERPGFQLHTFDGRSLLSEDHYVT